jgi:hypothetical protein
MFEEPPKVLRADYRLRHRCVSMTENVMNRNRPLFDHLVGTGQQRSWNLDAKFLRSLEVDE